MIISEIKLSEYGGWFFQVDCFISWTDYATEAKCLLALDRYLELKQTVNEWSNDEH